MKKVNNERATSKKYLDFLKLFSVAWTYPIILFYDFLEPARSGAQPSTKKLASFQFPVFSNVTNLNQAPKSNFYLKDQITPNKSEEGKSGVEDQDLYQRTSSGAI